MNPKILIVVTSHAVLGQSGQSTGFWLEELAIPYLEFARAGATIDIASPKGGRPPADPKSTADTSAEVKAFLADPVAQEKLANTERLDRISTSYDAVFLVGGHGTMFDLPTSKALADLLSKTYAEGHVVAAVCHGPAGLLAAKKSSGEPLVKGLRVAAFSNEEEVAVKLDKIVPFSLETQLREQGARYERGPMWQAFTVRDGKLVTGQNPTSSKRTALETLAALRE